MDPLTLMAILGGASTVWSFLKPKTEAEKGLQPGFWKKYYSPERVRAGVEPTRQLAQQRLSRTMGRTGETWGGRGLLSTAGAKGEARGAERDYGSLMSQALSLAHQSEIEQASELGIGDWQRKYQEDLAQREMFGQLGSALMAPGIGALGRKAGYQEIKDLLTKYDKQPIMQRLLAQILSGKGVEGMGLYGKNDELMNAFIRTIFEQYMKTSSGTQPGDYDMAETLRKGISVGGK